MRLIARNGEVVSANQHNGKVLVTRFSTMNGRPFRGAGLPRATLGGEMDLESGEHAASGVRRIPRRFRASRADSSIRKPFRHARRRVRRSPTAKRWSADRLGSGHEKGALPFIPRNDELVPAYRHDQKLFKT